MTSQILEFQNSRKTQKTKYLESGTLVFLRIKKIGSLYLKG